jgi:hypothetical protein
MISSIAAIAGRSIRRRISTVVSRLALLSAACLAGILGILFLTGAAYLRLAEVWGEPAAALVVAGFWSLAAALLAAAALRSSAQVAPEAPVAEEAARALLLLSSLLALLNRRFEASPEPSGEPASPPVAEAGSPHFSSVVGIGAGLIGGFLLARIIDRNLPK